MQARSSRSGLRWMCFIIRNILTRRVCCAPSPVSVRALKILNGKIASMRSRGWFRICCTFRRAALSLHAAIRKRSNARFPKFPWNPSAVIKKSGAFMPDANEPLLSVQHLKKYFPIHRGVLGRVAAHVKAVDDISFDINKGETFGLVGESGCGKTTAGRAILRLLEPDGGTIQFDGIDLLSLKKEEL